jgi:hypothetical protein
MVVGHGRPTSGLVHGKPKRRRACRGKVRYRDRGLAERALRNLRGRSLRHRMPTRAYYCPACAGFHLTAQPERQQFINNQEESSA